MAKNITNYPMENFLQFWQLHKNLLETLAIDAFARKNSQAQLSDQLLVSKQQQHRIKMGGKRDNG